MISTGLSKKESIYASQNFLPIATGGGGVP